ncbi:MAG: RluA family pseudouridine synthase [Solirubrobacteraceae bacterium]
MRGGRGESRTIAVPPDAAGARLDVFLAGPLGSRSEAARMIDAGAVRVDGAVRPRRHRLAGGERVSLQPRHEPRPPATAADIPFAVAYEDDSLMVIDKPAGVVVHPARGHSQGTLAQALHGRAGGGPDASRAGIVHRLDRDTSGLLVVARSDPVHRALRRLLAARGIERQYLALVEGRPPARSGTIDAPIGRDRRARTRMSTDTDDPRPARTHFALERALPSSTLLRVRLETGRTHQIRAHLQAIGHPVAGDAEYGHPGLYGLARQFLHATVLAFVHPVTSSPVRVESPLPADLAAALERAAVA